MITVKDLMKFCVKHGVTISVEASPTPNMVDMPVVNIKVSDWNTNKHYSRLINLFDLYNLKEDVDIVDYILNEASYKLGLDNSPEQRIWDEKVSEFQRTHEPDAVRYDGVEISYSDYKKYKEY